MHLFLRVSVLVFGQQRSWCPAPWGRLRAALFCSARCSDCHQIRRSPFPCRSAFASWPWVCLVCWFGIGSRGTTCYAVASQKHPEHGALVTTTASNSRLHWETDAERRAAGTDEVDVERLAAGPRSGPGGEAAAGASGSSRAGESTTAGRPRASRRSARRVW